MNIIYLDSLFFVNFVCDYILLLCTARVGGAVIRRGAILIASALGGIYACLCCIKATSWLGHPIIQLCCSVLLCLISYSGEKNLMRCILMFLCISAMTGGLLSAASISLNGIQYIPLQFKSILLAFSLVYFILTVFFRNMPRLSNREYHKVTVTLLNKTVSFHALRDNGNELYDPISNRPVLICRPDVLYPLFPESFKREEDAYLRFAQLSQLEDYKNRIRLIPCRTVTGKGMLLAFKADTVTINEKTEPHIIAFSEIQFTPDSPYQAIY